jgi:alpha-beta hydrolase superfamily lysophospholipase
MRRYLRKIPYIILGLFILANIIAAFHAYRFTHFSGERKKQTRKPEELSFFKKIAVLTTGVDNPRPENDTLPAKKFEEIKLKGHDGMISCWMIPKEKARGIVILFHGYAACKSKMLREASAFDSLGYQTMLVDFEGCGASDGYRTTIGYYEAEDVLAAYYYAKQIDSNIILQGISMGASAVIRAVSIYHLHPSEIILECPYGSMLSAAKNRFKIMGVPSFPMAHLLVFWGGLENGYWAFGQDCIHDAKDISCPVLLMRGKEDKYVSLEEVSGIYQSLAGQKKLYQFDCTGHESYCTKDHNKWVEEVTGFLGI